MTDPVAFVSAVRFVDPARPFWLYRFGPADPICLSGLPGSDPFRLIGLTPCDFAPFRLGLAG